jgi:putative ABC transport system ATP-binding protein
MSETIVSLRNVVKHYTRGKQDVPVLDGLDLDIAKGEFVALMGPSGSGKTTLLNLIGGLDTPTSGEITVAGQRLDPHEQRSARALARQPRRLRVPVLQLDADAERAAQRRAAVAAHQSVRAQRAANALAALTLVGIADRAKHKPGELSGGQAQRVAIARALVADAPLLVCDEPTGDLDRKSADEILHLLQILNREHGKTIVIVTHDPKAAEFGSRSCTWTRARCSTPARSRPEERRPMKYLPLLWATCGARRRARSSPCCRWPSRSCCTARSDHR